MHRELQDEEKRILDLELQQARYEADLAERRYAACDPDNRLIAAQLEKNWEATLRRVQEVQARCCLNQKQETVEVDPTAFANLADNLSAAWNAPGVTMRARQQLLRALTVNIVVDVDDQAREVVLVIHWRGGQHSELRVRKPRTGEHGCATTEDALAVMRRMAGRWSDEHIAASLNRMGIPTGQGKTWTAKRVSSVRRVRNIHAYLSAEKGGDWLTMSDAAKAPDVQPCGPARTNRPLPAAPVHSMVVARGRRPTAVPSWCVLGLDRAPEPSCHRQRDGPMRRRSCRDARATPRATSRRRQPIQRASNAADRCRGGRRSATADRAGCDRNIC